MSERSSCGASLGNVKISDVDFAVDAVILAETLDVLMAALEALIEELELLGRWFPDSKLNPGFQWYLGCCYLVCTCLW